MHHAFSSLAIFTCSTLGVALASATPAFAGGSSENVVLIVDPSSSDSLWAANHYASARQIPACNVLYMDPGAVDFVSFEAQNIPALLGSLEGRGIGDHVDCIVVMPGTHYSLPAPGLVSDGCVPVSRFGIAGAYSLAFDAGNVLGGVTQAYRNRYWSGDGSVQGFDSETLWLNGQPTTSPSGKRYFISAMLGYTGERGNSMAEILAMVDRSVAVDGTFPSGTTYYMRTTDAARSAPRHDFYVGVAASIVALGGNAVRLFADLPLGQYDCNGIMTGRANLDILGADMTLMPGSFADHLTSYAGHFDTASQTKMSEWIAKGASATSGAIQEPCNYAGKFPHARLHLYYQKGLPLGEAWLRSMEYVPFQNLLYGDPLTRPYTHIPSVDVPNAPTAPVSGTLFLNPVVATTAPGASIAKVELMVDGVIVRAGAAGTALPFQSAIFGDGWHELRVIATDDTDLHSSGSWVGSVEVNGAGRSATLTSSLMTGDQAQAFDLTLSATPAGLVEQRVLQSGRVIASTSSASATLRVYGVGLGAGPAKLQAEALFSDGMRVRSAPVTIDVTSSGLGSGTAPPTAFSHSVSVPVDVVSVLELPAAFDDALSSAVFEVLSAPSMATLATPTGTAFLSLTPQAGALGSDSITWRVTTPSGISGSATLTIDYTPASAGCQQPTSFCNAAPNSASNGTVLLWLGHPSVLENDSALYAVGAVPGQPGLFFYGTNSLQVPFGDGFRCVGGTTTRLGPALMADAFGDVQRSIDLNALPAALGTGEISPGSTLYFQYWYRDPAGPLGTGFNLSSGLSVTFCP